jgi:hypothetical protein
MSTISGRPGRLPPASGEGFWEPGPAADAAPSLGSGGGAAPSRGPGGADEG